MHVLLEILKTSVKLSLYFGKKPSFYGIRCTYVLVFCKLILCFGTIYKIDYEFLTIF